MEYDNDNHRANLLHLTGFGVQEALGPQTPSSPPCDRCRGLRELHRTLYRLMDLEDRVKKTRDRLRELARELRGPKS